MHLTEKLLAWFQPYISETQVNKITSTNTKVQYMFSTQEGFIDRLTQMYRDTKEEKTVVQKIYALKQTKSAMNYTIEFQSLAVQINWNNKAFMAQYLEGLKPKVLDVLILMNNPNTIKELINKVVQIDNRIY